MVLNETVINKSETKKMVWLGVLLRLSAHKTVAFCGFYIVGAAYGLFSLYWHDFSKIIIFFLLCRNINKI